MRAAREPVHVPAQWLGVGLAAGVLTGAAYTLSPLTIIAAALGAALLWLGPRGLPEADRRALRTLLAAAIVLRVGAVLALFLSGDFDHQAATLLTGDEGYALSRTLRLRNVLLDIPGLKYDYAVAFDEYGRTSFLAVMTVLQVLFGPAPYGLRLLNMLLFLTGVAVLFRLARPSFGRTPALAGAAVLMFLPTLFFWSISLLKEPLYLTLAVTVMAGAVTLVRGTGRARAAALAVIAVALWSLDGLRPGAVALVGGGTAFGLLIYAGTRTPRRAAIALLVAIAAALAIVAMPATRARVLTGLNAAAGVHYGHVFTVGHAYKLMDEGFYVRWSPEPTMTLPEAARFVVRGVGSFVAVPLPWQIATRSELAFMPEQLLWYLLVLAAPFGVVAGFRADPLLTCVLLGYLLPTALVVALTNGNVGTLIRFRGLVTPSLVWLSALGLCVIATRALTCHRATDAGLTPALQNSTR